MDRMLRSYVISLMWAGAAALSVMLTLGLVASFLDQYGWGYRGFFHLRIEELGGMPYWFVAVLVQLLTHAVLVARFAFLAASVEVPSHDRWGDWNGTVRAHLPIHVLSVLGVDLIVAVLLVLLFLCLRAWGC